MLPVRQSRAAADAATSYTVSTTCCVSVQAARCTHMKFQPGFLLRANSFAPPTDKFETETSHREASNTQQPSVAVSNVPSRVALPSQCDACRIAWPQTLICAPTGGAKKLAAAARRRSWDATGLHPRLRAHTRSTSCPKLGPRIRATERHDESADRADHDRGHSEVELSMRRQLPCRIPDVQVRGAIS
jgi:hypothetical protein